MRLLVIDGLVYDVTPLFVPGAHPGGSQVLTETVGGDATDAFCNSHPVAGRAALLLPFLVGTQSDWSVTPATAAYRALRAELEASGDLSLGSSPEYYAASASRAVLAAAMAIGAVAYYRDSFSHLMGAVALGVFWQQLAFIGHDLGHNSVSGRRSVDKIAGLLCGPALTGISFSWWKATHNVHHVATNSASGDPDVQHLPLLALSPHFFSSLWSTFHAKRMTFRGCERATVQMQHLFFYPLMFFARWNLYFQGVVHVLAVAPTLVRLEAAALAFFFTWTGVLVAAVGRGEASLLAAFAVRVVFLLICNGVAGFLHVQICVSHFMQPILRGRATDEGKSFLSSQLEGTMNVTLPEFADPLFGGLQFQVEHHLFPRLPAQALRALQPRIRALAAAHSLPYNEKTFSGACTHLYETLRATARAAKGIDGRVWDAAMLRG
jgi:delta8-fatty-acid desaturase